MAGRSGNRPLPRAVKLLRGETRPSRLGRREPTPRLGIPPRPAHLLRHAAAEWDRLVGLLTPLRVLTVADGPMLEAVAAAYQHMREADQALRRGGYQRVTTRSGGVMVRQHPALAVRAEAWRRYVIGLAHFGLSPSSRTRVHAQPPNEQDDFSAFDGLQPGGKLARFIGGRR